MNELKRAIYELESRLNQAQTRNTRLDQVLHDLKHPKSSLNYIIRDGWVQAFQSNLPILHEEDHLDGEDGDVGITPWSKTKQVAGRRDEESQVYGSYGVFECGTIKVADSSTKFINLSSKVRLAKWVRSLQSSPFSICPESGWLRWDLEIDNPVTYLKDTPNLELGSEFLLKVSNETPYVMKKDGASGGTGIVFVRNLQQIKHALDIGREMEEALPFLEDRKDSISSWAIQRHIDHPMLLDGHKFHLRSYLVSVGNRVFFYKTFEVRIAPVKWDADFEVKGCHITNGGGSDAHHERRYLSTQFPELEPATRKIPEFLRFIVSNCQEAETAVLPDDTWIACAIIGLDIMVDVDYNLNLLEGNHSPAAPPFDELHRFGCHVRRFCQRLVRLLIVAPTGGIVPGFEEIYI